MKAARQGIADLNRSTVTQAWRGKEDAIINKHQRERPQDETVSCGSAVPAQLRPLASSGAFLRRCDVDGAPCRQSLNYRNFAVDGLYPHTAVTAAIHGECPPHMEINTRSVLGKNTTGVAGCIRPVSFSQAASSSASSTGRLFRVWQCLSAGLRATSFTLPQK